MLIKSFILLLFLSQSAFAKLKIVTTTTNLKSLVQEIAGEHADVLSITKGVQDPHYIEAKPSYMLKLAKADLLISLGLGLEDGWLPLVIRGARRPELRNQSQHHIVASSYIKLLGVIDPKEVTRADGDVHPQGNPHFMLSPKASMALAKVILQRLSQLDPTNAKDYNSQYQSFIDRMSKLYTELKAKIKKDSKVITYHRTLTYFFHDFDIQLIDVLEPKPGIPPSAKHIISLIKKIKEEKIKTVLIENFFDDSVAHRIENETNGVSFHTVPVAVEGAQGIKNLFDLYRFLGVKFYE